MTETKQNQPSDDPTFMRVIRHFLSTEKPAESLSPKAPKPKNAKPSGQPRKRQPKSKAAK